MRKISETFLDFIDPILEGMGHPDPGTAEFDSVVKIGWTVWNAIISNDVEGNPKHLREISELTPPPLSFVTELLISRKRDDFSEYSYFLGLYEVKQINKEEYVLRMESRESKGIRAH